LNEIADVCGITKKMTFHLTHYTFDTLVLTKGVPIKSVSKMIGCSKVSTSHICAKVIEKKLGEILFLLLKIKSEWKSVEY